MDKGPWFIFYGEKPEQKLLGVQSEDFTHDVWLEVHGDFGGVEYKRAYCEWLAFTLNKKPAAWRLLWEAREARITELEAACEKAEYELDWHSDELRKLEAEEQLFNKTFDAQQVKIERLREALQHITRMNDHNFRVSDIHDVAKAALLGAGDV